MKINSILATAVMAFALCSCLSDTPADQTYDMAYNNNIVLMPSADGSGVEMNDKPANIVIHFDLAASTADFRFMSMPMPDGSTASFTLNGVPYTIATGMFNFALPQAQVGVGGSIVKITDFQARYFDRSFQPEMGGALVQAVLVDMSMNINDVPVTVLQSDRLCFGTTEVTSPGAEAPFSITSAYYQLQLSSKGTATLVVYDLKLANNLFKLPAMKISGIAFTPSLTGLTLAGEGITPVMSNLENAADYDVTSLEGTLENKGAFDLAIDFAGGVSLTAHLEK